MNDQTITSDGQWHGRDYSITIKVANNCCNIELQQKFQPCYWKNSFTQAYIEELTSQTGGKISFQEFIKVLSTCLNKKSAPSQLVSLDILTYTDLQNMKNKKSNNTSTSAPVSTTNNNKRYLIVSYSAVEGSDQLHYPLSLNIEETVDPEKLQSILKRVKTQIDDYRSNMQDSHMSFEKSIHREEKNSFFLTDKRGTEAVNMSSSSLSLMSADQVKEENDKLKYRIRKLEDYFSQKKGAVQFDQIVRGTMDLETQIAMVRQESMQDVFQLRNTISEKELLIQRKRKEVVELRRELNLPMVGEEAEQRMRDRILKLSDESEFELTTSRRAITRQQKDIEKMTLDLEQIRMADQKQQNRIKQLETQLENALQKQSSRGVTDRLYSPYGGSNSGTQRRANSVPIKSASPSVRSSPSYNRNGVSPGSASSSQNSFTNKVNSPASANVNNRNQVSPSYNYNMKKTNSAASPSAINANKQAPSPAPASRVGPQSANVRAPISGTTGGGYGYQNRNNAPRTAVNANSSPGIQSALPNNKNPSPGVGGRNYSPSYNKLTTNNKVSPVINSKTNFSNTPKTNVPPAQNYGAPVTRNAPQTTNNRVSPSSRYNAPSSSSNTYNKQPLGSNNRNNLPMNKASVSPSAQYNNFMGQGNTGDKNLIKQIDDIKTNMVVKKEVSREFSDVHLNVNYNQAPQQAVAPSSNYQDVDNRLDQLHHLLIQAKQ